MRSIRTTLNFNVPILFSHQIWGREPPCLCLILEERLSVTCEIREGEKSYVRLRSQYIDESAKNDIEKILNNLLEDLSPSSLNIKIRIISERRYPALSYAVSAIDAMLMGLQRFYRERIEERDYIDVLTGALTKARLSLNQARCLAKSHITKKSLIYSETDGSMNLDENYDRVKIELIRESSFSKAWSEPDIRSHYLDMLSKLSSTLIAELPSFLRGEISPGPFYRMFNSIWYIYGVPTEDIEARGGNVLVTVSLPKRIAVLGIEWK